MINRRTFLAYSGGTALTLFLVGGNGIPQAVGQVAGGSLDPAGVPQFLTPLLVPPVMPTHGRLTAKGGRNADYYEISMRQFRQQILPDGLPQTTVWGYGPARAPRRGTAVHHAPSLTIEAKWETPVRIKWVNDLVADDGTYLPHLLPVDPTLHWANPGRVLDDQGRARTDTRPSYAGKTYVKPAEFTDPATQYTDYRGPVPIVTHVHGAMGIGDESDGYPRRGTSRWRAICLSIMRRSVTGMTSTRRPMRRNSARPGDRAMRSRTTPISTGPPRSGITTTP